jgi:hypothetical protein
MSGARRDRGGPGGKEQDRFVLACVAAGSLVAGAGLFWATKKLLDYYVPYEVGRGGRGGGAAAAARRSGAARALAARRCAPAERARRPAPVLATRAARRPLPPRSTTTARARSAAGSPTR